MSDDKRSKTAHSSPSDIINTFNTFFTNIPTNKSFDMTYKVYIRDLADIEDRAISVSARSSMMNLQPLTIASHGIVPTMSTSSTTVDKSLQSISSSKTSSTSLKTGKSGPPSSKSVTMSQIDRICADNQARKQRSLVDLTDLNRIYGNLPPPKPSANTPPTVYENLTVYEDSTAPSTSNSSNTSTFGKKKREFEKILESDSNVDLYIKVSDCFD